MLVLLLAAALASTPATPAAAPPAVEIILVRHAEAASEPAADPGLTDAGRARVACLLQSLKDEKLTHVLTSPYRRSRETGGPIAAEHGLEAATRDPLDAKALAAELASLPAGSTALVVGHSNTIPALVAALGGGLEGLVEERGQPALPRDQFDRLVRVRLRSDAPDDASRLLDVKDALQAPCPSPD